LSRCTLLETGEKLGPVDSGVHAMFGWRVEEEAKIRFIITAVDRGACRSAEHVGLQLADAKRILGRLKEIVVSEQLQRHCEPGRPCTGSLRRRHLKDHRRPRFDKVFGRLDVRAPTF